MVDPLRREVRSNTSVILQYSLLRNAAGPYKWSVSASFTQKQDFRFMPGSFHQAALDKVRPLIAAGQILSLHAYVIIPGSKFLAFFQ